MSVPNDAPSRVLLVEGVDDKHVTDHLLQRNVSKFEILDKGGIDPLLNAIEAEVRAPSRQIVGILVDANDSLKNRWMAVASQLHKADIVAPEEPDPAGTIIDSTPRVGIWLMPNNQESGELEDFVAGMIPANDAVWPLSKKYVNDIPDDARKFRPGKTLRAKVHSWLATREEPRKMGAAIGAGDLNVTAPEAVRFVKWLQRLFG